MIQVEPFQPDEKSEVICGFSTFQTIHRRPHLINGVVVPRENVEINEIISIPCQTQEIAD